MRILTNGECDCCGGAGCACGTCNYVAVLLFCGTRGVADQYEIYFQGVLVTTITDNAVALGCRVFMIGNVADVCSTVIANLKATYGETAVTTVQVDGLDDVPTCDDVIEGDDDCDEVTLTVTPLGGVAVSGLSYTIYTVCHEAERKNCCSYTNGGPLSGGAGVAVPISWADACCCCCPFFMQCVEGEGHNFTGTTTASNMLYELITVDGGGVVTVLDSNNTDTLSTFETFGLYCTGISGTCFKGFLTGLPDPSGAGHFFDVDPDRHCLFPDEVNLCLWDDLITHSIIEGLQATLDDNNFNIVCRNGTLSVAVNPYGVYSEQTLPHDPTPGFESFRDRIYGIYYNPNDPTSIWLDAEPETYACTDGYSSATFRGITYQHLCMCDGLLIGSRTTFDLTITCGTPPPTPFMAIAESSKRTAIAVNRPSVHGKCAYLGERTEFRKGCFSGRTCQHECDHPDDAKRALHMIAVPAGNCQTCPDWSDIG